MKYYLSAAHFTVLFLCFGTTSSSIFAMNHARRRNLCQPLEIPACRKLGYNQTRIPTDLYPSMPFQEVKKYIELLNSIKCSKDLLFFLCTMYSPVCFAGYVPRVLPCRSVCESVKEGCLAFIRIAGFTWPSELDCRRLPEYNTGVCIQPSAIVSKEGSRHKKNLAEVVTEKCPVCGASTVLKRYKQFKKASYVIAAEVKSRITTANKETKLIVSVRDIYKQGKVKMSRGHVELWSASKCICPEVEFDTTYYILGQEDKRKRRPLFDHRSIIAKTSIYLERKMQRWSVKYNRMLARKLKRKQGKNARDN